VYVQVPSCRREPVGPGPRLLQLPLEDIVRLISTVLLIEIDFSTKKIVLLCFAS
jgi:hypothetical protein